MRKHPTCDVDIWAGNKIPPMALLSTKMGDKDKKNKKNGIYHENEKIRDFIFHKLERCV